MFLFQQSGEKWGRIIASLQLCSEPQVCAQWTYTVQLLYHPKSGCGNNMSELRSCFIRNFYFREGFKLVLNVEPVHSSRNAALPLTCSHTLKQFAGLEPRTQMEVPEEEAGRFVSANTLNSFKNSWCWLKIQDDQLILFKTHCEFWIWDDVSPAFRHKIFHKNRGLFNYWCPQKCITDKLFSFPHEEAPSEKRQGCWKSLRGDWNEGLSPQYFSTVSKATKAREKSTLPVQPSWGATVGQRGPERMRQGVEEHHNSWHIICMNVLSCCLLLGMVRGDTVIQSSLNFTKIHDVH